MPNDKKNLERYFRMQKCNIAACNTTHEIDSSLLKSDAFEQRFAQPHKWGETKLKKNNIKTSHDMYFLYSLTQLSAYTSG